MALQSPPGTPEHNEEIFRELKRGLGHEHVTDDNVFELIAIAHREGHQLLEQELREWQSPCGDGGAGEVPNAAPASRDTGNQASNR